MTKPSISVVSPVYGCVESIDELCQGIIDAVSSITSDFEILLVDDASPDNAWSKISSLAISNPHIKGIRLSRNFGQQKAIFAGIENSTGDFVVVMDCDLQDNPEAIFDLYAKVLEGYDLVVVKRKSRTDSNLRRFLSNAYSKVFSFLINQKFDNRLANFGIYSKKVIKSILLTKEQNVSFCLSALWVGFNRAEIEVDHGVRIYGESSYTFRMLMNYALNLSISYSDKVIRLVVKVGFLTAATSFSSGCIICSTIFSLITCYQGGQV